MGIKGLNHPGIDLVDHFLDAGRLNRHDIKITLERDIFRIRQNLEQAPPEKRAPAHINELHILEVAQTYLQVEDFADREALNRLRLALNGFAAEAVPLPSALLRGAGAGA